MIESEYENIKFLYIDNNTIIKANNIIHIEGNDLEFYTNTKNSNFKTILEEFGNKMIKFFDLKELSHKNKELVYISRSKVRLRRMIGERSLAQLLQNKGFKIIHPQDINFKEQINIFLNAKLVVGTYGAAFTNIIYSGQGLNFLEISPKKYRGLEFSQIANILDFNRHEIVSNTEFVWQWFFIDRKTLLSKIESILKIINKNN